MANEQKKKFSLFGRGKAPEKAPEPQIAEEILVQAPIGINSELSTPEAPIEQEAPIKPWETPIVNKVPTNQEEMPLPKEREEIQEDEQELTGESDEQGDEQENEEEPEIRTMEAPKDGQKFWLRKLVYKSSRTKEGKPYNKPVFKTLDEFIGRPPTIDDIESIYSPLWGGGEYLIIDAATKKLYKKFTLDGPPLDPESNEVPVQAKAPAPAPAQVYPYPAPAHAPAPAPVYQAPAPTPAPASIPPGQPQVMERIQQVMVSGQTKAVEQLANLADRLMASGDTDNLQKVIDALSEIATGKRSEKSEDKFMTFLMADRQNQQALLNTLLTNKDKGPNSNDVMMQSMGMFKEMMGVARELAPQGEDMNVAMVREIGGVVKDSMRDVTDTVVRVTGSGELKPEGQHGQEKVAYKCSQCGTQVQPNWKICPECGLRFSGVATPPQAPARNLQMKQKPAVERFENPAQQAPKIPEEIKGRLSYLRNLAVFIRDGHDPVPKGSGLFKMCGPEERVALLFTAEFGYKNLMRMANPYRGSDEIPDVDAVFKIVESEKGKEWITAFFGAIKQAAKEENVALTDGDREHFITELNKFSAVKFNVRPQKAAPVAAPQVEKASSTRIIEPPAMKERRIQAEQPYREAPAEAPADLEVDIPTPLRGPDGQLLVAKVPMGADGPKAAMTTCPVCNAMVLSSQLKEHLFTNHPKQKKAKPSFRELTPEEMAESQQMNEPESEEDGLTS
jgi:hypothetical protein